MTCVECVARVFRGKQLEVQVACDLQYINNGIQPDRRLLQRVFSLVVTCIDGDQQTRPGEKGRITSARPKLYSQHLRQGAAFERRLW